MKIKLINIFITILLLTTIILKIYNNNLFIIYNNYLVKLFIITTILSSIYFTYKLKFLQINIKKLKNNLKSQNKNNYKALFMSLGAKIGVGSIVGISLAISIAGEGVLLWIIIINTLSSILTYCESYLGVKYKDKNNGGIFNYIEKRLNNKTLAIIYTIILIFVYAIGFIGIQSNTIIKSVNLTINTNDNIIIILLILLISIIIFNNTNKIINIMSKIVPIMCLLYITLGIIILINNKENLPIIINKIIKDAINPKNKILNIIAVAIQRGTFATESGLGTSSIASSISNDKPSTQATIQLLGCHFITLIIITITGLIIINNKIYTTNGIELLIISFSKNFGKLGIISLIIIITLFAISTIISSYYYMLRGIKFIKRNLDNLDKLIIKIFVIFLTLLGSITKSTIIWSIADTLIIFLLLINIYTLIKLNKEIK